MFNGPSPIAMPFKYSQNLNPTEMELMMRQKFNQTSMNQMQQNTTDPYTEFQMVMNNCSPNIRFKIMQDKEYLECDQECENLIKQALEETLIPQIIMTPNGRIVFERFLGVTKKLKDKYTQEEMETNQQLQQLMQDEVVQQRLRELNQQKAKNKK